MLEEDETIVAMLEHKGEMYIATTHHIYIKLGDTIQPVKFRIVEEYNDD